jgi:hypothetical protein
MGYDHAVKKEVLVPSSSSGSSGNAVNETLSDKQKEELERQDTITTVSDEESGGPPEGMLPMQHSHTHHLGKLILRAVDDEDPS